MMGERPSGQRPGRHGQPQRHNPF